MLRDFIVSLLGEYEPLYNVNDDPLVGLAGVDWPWVIGAACFVVMLLGVISVLRVLLKGFLK